MAVDRERELIEGNPDHDFSFLDNLPKMQVIISEPNAKPAAFNMDAQAATKFAAKKEASVKAETMDCDPNSDDEPIQGQAPSNAADIFRSFDGTRVQADAQPDFGYKDGTLVQQERQHFQNVVRERALLNGFSSYHRDIDMPMDSFQSDQPRLEKIDASMFQDEDAAFDPVVPPPLPPLKTAPTRDTMLQNVAPAVSFGPSFDAASSHHEEAAEDYLMRIMNN